MSRPSEAEINEALATLAFLGDGSPPERRALKVVHAALKPREPWPAKEAAACLGVRVSNLRTVKGLPKPAWVFDRSRPDFPERVHVLYWRDEIEALAEVRRAGKAGG